MSNFLLFWVSNRKRSHFSLRSRKNEEISRNWETHQDPFLSTSSLPLRLRIFLAIFPDSISPSIDHHVRYFWLGFIASCVRFLFLGYTQIYLDDLLRLFWCWYPFSYHLVVNMEVLALFHWLEVCFCCMVLS